MTKPAAFIVHFTSFMFLISSLRCKIIINDLVVKEHCLLSLKFKICAFLVTSGYVGLDSLKQKNKNQPHIHVHKNW